MIVALTGAGAVVEDRDDLTRLHVQAGGADDATADAALRSAGLGHVEGGHAWLAVTALRTHGHGDGIDWLQRYDAMIDYALGKGWGSSDGTHVRAHLERTGV